MEIKTKEKKEEWMHGPRQLVAGPTHHPSRPIILPQSCQPSQKPLLLPCGPHGSVAHTAPTPSRCHFQAGPTAWSSFALRTRYPASGWAHVARGFSFPTAGTQQSHGFRGGGGYNHLRAFPLLVARGSLAPHLVVRKAGRFVLPPPFVTTSKPTR